ncbi:MAG: ferredoxin--NADP reductase [Robiginitomaculum sp.]|nr:ferredoxin--NADP reductase [Robiginitomaculum sp.]MDQ7077208.1 ferredoxin--NADP reductase [Robiginitomaculum sp.]
MTFLTTTSAPVEKPHSLPQGMQVVTAVRHWDDQLFSFRVKRPRSFRFRSGEFVMIGLPTETGKPCLRAYSIASPSWDEELEFYSIKVPNGPLTSRLQHIKPGDRIILRPKAVGTLVLDALLPAKRLWLFATGTGFAPFASIIRDPDCYVRYDEVIVTHTARTRAGLAYAKDVIQRTLDDPLVGQEAREKLICLSTTTQETSPDMGRITDMLRTGQVFEKLGMPVITPKTDRAMICGSMAFNLEMKDILEGGQMREGANSAPADYVVEKAFVG